MYVLLGVVGWGGAGVIAGEWMEARMVARTGVGEGGLIPRWVYAALGLVGAVASLLMGWPRGGKERR